MSTLPITLRSPARLSTSRISRYSARAPANSSRRDSLTTLAEQRKTVSPDSPFQQTSAASIDVLDIKAETESRSFLRNMVITGIIITIILGLIVFLIPMFLASNATRYMYAITADDITTASVKRFTVDIDYGSIDIQFPVEGDEGSLEVKVASNMTCTRAGIYFKCESDDESDVLSRAAIVIPQPLLAVESSLGIKLLTGQGQIDINIEERNVTFGSLVAYSNGGDVEARSLTLGSSCTLSCDEGEVRMNNVTMRTGIVAGVDSSFYLTGITMIGTNNTLRVVSDSENSEIVLTFPLPDFGLSMKTTNPSVSPDTLSPGPGAVCNPCLFGNATVSNNWVEVEGADITLIIESFGDDAGSDD